MESTCLKVEVLQLVFSPRLITVYSVNLILSMIEQAIWTNTNEIPTKPSARTIR